jgi:hyperosmotically inducible periplasmic protein
MNFTQRIGKEVAWAAVSLFLGASMPARLVSQDHTQQPAPDNSKTNQRDRDQSSPTADQQKMNLADRDITKKIRSAIHNDKSLSSYAHNIKVITQDGKVTLKGPVRSDEEKTNIESKATAVAGEGNVTDQIEVAPPKS